MESFEVVHDDFVALLDLIPEKWAHFKRIFDSIFKLMPQHKYAIDDKKQPLYNVMDQLKFPKNGEESFYGLQKKWMPLPAVFILYPVLRYVPLCDSFLISKISLTILLKVTD